MIKVLFIVSWYFPYGYSDPPKAVGYEEMLELRNQCEVAVLYPYDRSLNTDYTAAVEGEGILTYRSLLKDGDRIGNNIRLWKLFKKIVQEFAPDIIFARVGSDAGKITCFFAKLYKMPYIVKEHSAVEALGLVPGGKKKDFALLRVVYGNADYVACVSDDLRDKLADCFPKIKFHTIYNGIKMQNISDSIPKTYCVNQVVNIIIVAAFYNKEVKGFQHLLPAISQVIADGYHVVLHICGDGIFRTYYEEMAATLGIKDNCIFYGNVAHEEVLKIMKQMDFLVSASLYESAGKTVQEAMLLGKPVLVTKSGGANSLATQDTAIVVDKGSTQALADGLKEMIQKYQKFDTGKIKEYAESRFAMKHIIDQYMEIFQDILSAKKRRKGI